MTFKIEKLGRIASASIDLKPLTLLIGKNDSGKTYCASALWSFIKFVENQSPESVLKKFSDELSPLNELANAKFQGRFSFKLTADRIRASQKSTREEFAKNRGKLLADAIGYNGFKDSLLDFHPEGQVESLEFHAAIRSERSVEQLFVNDDSEEKLNFDDINTFIEYEVRINGEKVRTIEGEVGDLEYASTVMRHWIAQDISGYSIFGKTWNNYRNTTYIPAARTGIMLAIDFFVSGAMQRSLSPTSKQPKPSTSLPAPLGAFAANLTYPFFRPDSAKLLASIVSGSYQKTAKRGEYQYTPTGMESPLPLAATSSLVTELAGFALTLGAVDARDSFVIFEEPEAHLHLEAQREIAKILVTLVNKGKRLLVTTHSDTFLQQINNLIALHDHPKADQLRTELGIKQRETISRESVAAYDFHCVNGSTIVEYLPCTKRGFVAASLNEVLIKLTNETLAIGEGLDD